MRKDLTEIAIILDRSGSMFSIREDTIGGFNTFIKDQKKISGSANITLTSFNHEVERVRNCEDIKEIKEITLEDYIPAGFTALYDGIGTTLDDLKANIDKRNEDDKPEKVVVVIITDGMENASKEYNQKQIKEKIESLQKDNDWEFIYLGANQDAFEAGGELGIPKYGTAKWKSTSDGSKTLYSNFSDTIKRYRQSGIVDLKSEDEESN
jgi:uncharacterized protein YegL